mmetsp:Transcript_24703/g.29859  ORF Transcript_24703/g.29859 Transcript_24703/m.29859 type:complete len:107 (-) Transcript_24703:389-709(-)
MAYRNATVKEKDKETSMTTEVLCQAQSLISKARREQLSILTQIIKFQANVRRYLAKTSFDHYKTSSNVIQSHIRLYQYRKRHGQQQSLYLSNVEKSKKFARGEIGD